MSAAARAMVLRAAGTNCDRETVAALELAGATADRCHVNRLCERPGVLAGYGVLVVPGGFSYGDDVMAGRIFGNQLRLKAGEALAGFIARGGVILGICNGFQVLVASGLLPGGDAAGRVTLSGNASAKFEARWVHLRAATSRSPLLEEGEVVTLPVAHAEGRLLAADGAAVQALRDDGQVAFRYVAADGGPARYPDNPNGAVDDIAGLIDPTGRILGLMPHPERHVDRLQHPRWTRGDAPAEGDGLRYFRRAIAAARSA